MADETKPSGGGRLTADRWDLGRSETGQPPALAPTMAVLPTEHAVPGAGVGQPPQLAQPAGLELPPGTAVGEYRVLRKLGEGGMGAVYAGEQPTIGKGVAIKVLAPRNASDPDLVRRFVEEARAANRIHHPHIIDIFSFGQLPDGRHYFVMELLDGESLAEAMDQQHLQPSELRRLLCQICHALEASHRAGIVHRDLKPENIWVARPPHGDSYVKLLDFGIAKLLDPTQIHLTQTGALMGTPLFMSPEQCLGRPVDAHTDIYALGVLLYRIFTGQYPFCSTVITELVYRHVTEAPVPPSRYRSLPPDLERIILECLAKEPAARPASAEVLGQRLGATLDSWTKISAAVVEPESALSVTSLSAVAPVGSITQERADGHGKKSSFRRSGALLGAGIVTAGLLAGGALLRWAPVAQPPASARPAEIAQSPLEIRPQATGRASISIQNGPDNRVWLDGREVAHGRSAVELTALTVESMHHLAIEAPGRRRFTRDFVVPAGSALDIPVLLEAEDHQPPAARGSAKTRPAGSLRAASNSPASVASKPTISEPAAVQPAPSPAEPVEPATAVLPVRKDNGPQPTRARERGLLDVNPLRQ